MKRKALILMSILFIFISIGLLAEKTIGQKRQDLEEKLKSASGKEKIEILNQLAYEYRSLSPKKMMEYANQALELSQKCKDVRGKAVALNNIGIGCRALAKYNDAIGYGQQALEIFKSLEDEKGVSDSLINVGACFIYIGKLEKAEEYQRNALEIKKKIVEKKGIALCLGYLGIINWRRGKYDEARRLHEKSLKINEEIGDKKAIANSLNNIGLVYLNLSNYQKALDYYHKSLVIRRELGDKKIIADTLNNIGIVYNKIGNYGKSLEYQLQSLEIKKENKNKKGIASSLNNIGNIYQNLDNFQKALDYHLIALEINRETGYKNGIAYSLNNIGLAYQSLKKYKKALDYYLQSLALKREIGNKRGSAATILNIGFVYNDLHDYDKSITYLLDALRLYETIKNKSGIANASYNIGEVYTKMRQYDKAILYIERCLQVSKEIEDLNLLRLGYQVFSDMYSAKGDYKKALEYHKLYSEVKDMIYNETSSQQIAELQTRYETLKKEQRIEILEKNNRIQGLQLSKERVTRNAFIFGFILVIIILVLLFRKYLYLFAFWKKQKYIGQFRLMEKIGSGGMGVIYKAHHIKNKSETYAVKVLREELSESREIIQRFKQEATIIDKLNHPHIVKIMERGQYKQRFFIAMELLEGKTLEKKLAEDGQMPLKECLDIMKQISAALSLIHGKNIIHRDLKPSNIMLVNKNGDHRFVKLLDFGIARMKFQTKMTRTGILLGTTNYLSPEQINNSGISIASDLFSLGIIFYEMVCGKKPFNGDNESDIIKDILEKQPPEPRRLRSEVPGELNTLIMRMLEKQEESRPSSLEALKVIHTMNRNL